MGHIQALEYAKLESGLIMHLRHNHYPPLPYEILGPAKRAIKNAQAGQWDKMVKLPPGTTYKGSKQAPTWACVDAWHLHSWVDREVD